MLMYALEWRGPMFVFGFAFGLRSVECVRFSLRWASPGFPDRTGEMLRGIVCVLLLVVDWAEVAER